MLRFKLIYQIIITI